MFLISELQRRVPKGLELSAFETVKLMLSSMGLCYCHAKFSTAIESSLVSHYERVVWWVAQENKKKKENSQQHWHIYELFLIDADIFLEDVIMAANISLLCWFENSVTRGCASVTKRPLRFQQSYMKLCQVYWLLTRWPSNVSMYHQPMLHWVKKLWVWRPLKCLLWQWYNRLACCFLITVSFTFI